MWIFYRKAGNKMTTQGFRKTDHVVYASNGICLIEDIKKMSFIRGEPEKVYYILKPLNDKNSTIYIPEDNELLLGKMRNIITKGEIEAIITDVKKADIEWIDDRKLRSASYREILSNPHPAVLLPLVKGISKKNAELSETGKKLAAADKDAFEISLGYIRDEFAFALGIKANEIKEYIENALGFYPSIV